MCIKNRLYWSDLYTNCRKDSSWYEGLSNNEAAQIIGVKVKALQSLVMRAKTTLKYKVKRYFGGGLR